MKDYAVLLALTNLKEARHDLLKVINSIHLFVFREKNPKIEIQLAVMLKFSTLFSQ